MKDYTKANQKKSNYTIDTNPLVSLEDIFPGISKFANNKKIKKMTVREQLENILSHLTASEQLRELEKLAMKIRKANNLKIELERLKTARKYPRIKT